MLICVHQWLILFSMERIIFRKDWIPAFAGMTEKDHATDAKGICHWCVESRKAGRILPYCSVNQWQVVRVDLVEKSK